MTRRLLGALLAIAAIGLSLAAITRRLDWQIQLGDLGTWVGGIGSTLAAFAAFVTLRELQRTRRSEAEEQRGRVRRRAARVQVRTIPCETSAQRPGWRVTLTNRSGHPIYDLKWGGLVAMRPEPPDIKTDFVCLPIESEFADSSPFVLDSESCGVEYLASPPEAREQYYPFPRIEFTDEDGYVFVYVVRRVHYGGEILGQWQLREDGTRSGIQRRQNMTFGAVTIPPEIQPQ